ncbi:polyadenylate-binding protein 1-like isoform X2 [Ipomoea triloba]|uniref:polyadenylate-binding protein 1-like isoform X2 n=1 Tax=Ipomoea triloba TaxID=35885 RepID=UPI00125E920C|nr:polyadenylate-binding protein 1-like isoform X2 [Ipomoea triloba]XP_031109059.1 polyadenylate-binding protein 1-like isoform X2 [Ipomoea triloba]XP_031109060.1 polyadenylate-binding protein 1-like isoform X2 [Ipomoea triloba]XP_031109061.1 polyadenylate-binding protein 1-like isoform X2 [Ipomoea triloba]XP_031109062.1 polyadenylate-binding protein 1-like isoform X2 [Ipomoea triloba]
MDGEENESFGEVEQQLRPGSAAKDLADIWKEIGEIKQKVAEIREIQAKLFEEYVLVDSSQGYAQKDRRNVQPGMSSTQQRRPRHFCSPYGHFCPKVPEDTGKDRTISQPSLTGQHKKWRR